MQKVTTLLKPIKRTKLTSQRQLIIKDCLDRINAERQGTKYKPMTPRTLAIKLGHLTTEDIKFHHAQCCKVKNYGRLFFGLIKNRK